MSEKELEEELTTRGSDYATIRYHHNIHKTLELEVARELEAAGVETRTVKRCEYNDEVVTALPVSDLESAPSQTSAGLIAGVIVCLAAMGLVVAGVGVTYYRRRKSHQAIISYLQAVSTY